MSMWCHLFFSLLSGYSRIGTRHQSLRLQSAEMTLFPREHCHLAAEKEKTAKGQVGQQCFFVCFDHQQMRVCVCVLGLC